MMSVIRPRHSVYAVFQSACLNVKEANKIADDLEALYRAASAALLRADDVGRAATNGPAGLSIHALTSN